LIRYKHCFGFRISDFVFFIRGVSICRWRTPLFFVIIAQMLNLFRSIIFWALLFFFVIFPLNILTIFLKGNRRAYQKTVSFFSKLLIACSFIRVKVIGKDHLKKTDLSKGLIIAANHFSFLDTFILLAKLPFPVRIVVHPAGFGMAFLKNVYKYAGYIGISMKKKKGTSHLFSLFNALKNNEKIMIYSLPAEKEGDFQFTPALLEISNRYQVPILPIGIKGSGKLLPMDKRIFSSSRVTLSIGRPAHFSNPESLKKEILNLHASFA
jgi:1-acyl-sn-glycerol-3-phosphate acyltransferase